MHLFFALLFLNFAFAQNPESCAQDCRLEQSKDQYESVCQCGSKKGWGVADDVFFRARFKGASAVEVDSAQKNLCQKAKAPPELAKLFALQTRPLCECVSVRTHFALQSKCAKTRTGSTDCRLNYVGQPSQKAKRSPTLFDYQSCVANRLNYRKPASCGDTQCEKKKPACKSGEELFNVADPESCCPVFVCRGKSD